MWTRRNQELLLRQNAKHTPSNGFFVILDGANLPYVIHLPTAKREIFFDVPNV
jgi:hypothetical protein